jgi:hypothetical protein
MFNHKIEKTLETSFMERQFQDLIEKANSIPDLKTIANHLLQALVVEKTGKDYLAGIAVADNFRKHKQSLLNSEDQ